MDRCTNPDVLSSVRRGQRLLVVRILGAVLLIASEGIVLGQTQLEELSPKSHYPAISDPTIDLGVADLDGDGDPDVIVGNMDGSTRLYLNDGGAVFVDVSAIQLPPPFGGDSGLALGDVEGDGDQDLLIGGSLTESCRLYVNDGAARFTDETALRMPPGIGRIEPLFGDLDGDGDLDLVLPRPLDQTLLLLNDGLGRFSDATVGRMPPDQDLGPGVLGDVDGDGDPDVVLASEDQDRLYLNDGAGFFTDVTATHLPQGSEVTTDTLLVDMDGDGDLDLVAGRDPNGADAVFLNDANGVFSHAANLPNIPIGSSHTLSVAAGDVDGDLDVDVVLGGASADRLCLNDGSTTFSLAPLPEELAQATRAVVLTDLDQDGDLDLLLGNHGQDRLYLNDGAGTFANATPERIVWATYETEVIEVLDLDMDGDEDIVTANIARPTAFSNDGTGTFAGVLLPMCCGHVDALAGGDMDGDGDPDLVIGRREACLGPCTPRPNFMLLNDGRGGFVLGVGLVPPDADETTAVELGDVDADGDLDVVFGNLFQQNRLYSNDGTGRLADVTAGRMPVLIDRTRGVALGDVDADLDLDIVVANQGQNRLLLNDGAATFFDATATGLPLEERTTLAVEMGDLDRDGDLDLLFGNSGRPGLYVNDGSGFFVETPEHIPSQTETTRALALGDVDGDGDLDVLLGNAGRNRLLLNDGSARFVDATDAWLPMDPEGSLAVALADLDQDRDLDLLVGNEATSSLEESRIYLNVHRQLWAPLLPIVGRRYELELRSQAPNGGGPSIGVLALSTGLLQPSVAVPPLNGGLALAPPWTLLPAMAIPSGGAARFQLVVPPDVGLIGTTFYQQGVIAGEAFELTGFLADTILP